MCGEVMCLNCQYYDFCEVFMDNGLMCLNCQYYERVEGEFVCNYPDMNMLDDWEVPCFRESEVVDE